MNDSTQITPEDVVGKRIFNPKSHMGLGVALEKKTVGRGRLESREVFACETAPHSGETLRDVDDIMERLNEGNYVLQDDPWEDER